MEEINTRNKGEESTQRLDVVFPFKITFALSYKSPLKNYHIFSKGKISPFKKEYFGRHDNKKVVFYNFLGKNYMNNLDFIYI